MCRLLLALLLLCSTQALAAPEYDKRMHIAASATIAASLYVVVERKNKSHWYTFGGCMAVGVAKEVYDELDYGGFSGGDLAADAVGCLAGILFVDTGWKFVTKSKSAGIKFSFRF